MKFRARTDTRESRGTQIWGRGGKKKSDANSAADEEILEMEKGTER